MVSKTDKSTGSTMSDRNFKNGNLDCLTECEQIRPTEFEIEKLFIVNLEVLCFNQIKCYIYT